VTVVSTPIALGAAPQQLDNAQVTVTAMSQLPPGLALPDAYAIQHAVLARRLDRGEHLIGIKLGFTSRAKMAQMGVSDIIVGQLTDAMRIPDGGEADLTRFIHPRIEPEIAFRLGRDLGPSDPGADIEAAVDAVAPALEIIDSRYREFRFSLPDVVADNTSAAAFVVGPWQPVGSSLANRAVRLTIDGEPAEIGSTAAILGHPTRALHALLAMADRYDFPLRAGDVVLAGAATAAVPFTAALAEARVAGLGTATGRGVPG
jgi:2-oxo-3-hexenedioate decarboxylase